MNFGEMVITFVGGGALVALISVLGERWKFRQEHKAKKEDRAEERKDRTNELSKSLETFEQSEAKKNEELETRLKGLENQMTAQTEALKLLMLDRILHLGQSYVAKGEISFDDRKRLHDMHKCYHDGLGGNGDAKLIIEAVDSLPMKKRGGGSRDSNSNQ